ncbi:hypothetical protein CCACVL1_22077 [Corchorus capsularis]|uniref:Uncharacterized protein n=1 Tax=Corchorus capsularis TaxID=210143 RepID=A0A1R3H148_COCAP|nr:hypothetical protein CCACVL1_22077 [Corchorus capsularis]
MEGNTKENSTPPALLVNDEEEEEERINAFFSLVRNIRDAQSRMLIGSQDGKDKDIDKGKEKSTWTPSFKLEDFAHHHHHAHLPNHTVTTALPSSSNTQQQNPKTDHQERPELDLNLSL